MKSFSHGRSILIALALVLLCGPALRAQVSPISSYSPETGVIELPFVDNQLSGVTYNWDRQSLFMIQNSGGTLWEMDLQFNLVRAIEIGGFGDSEDLCYIGDGEFAIVNEDSELYIGSIGDTTEELDAEDWQRVTFDGYAGNKGPEGVAYNPDTNEFFIVKEDNPMKLFRFDRPSTSENLTLQAEEPFDADTLPLNDLAAVAVDRSTGRLYILSQSSKTILEVDLSGTVMATLSASARSQPEGMTFVGETLYLVGEPDQIQLYGTSGGSCGNDVCDPTEDCSSCEADCGLCLPPAAPTSVSVN